MSENGEFRPDWFSPPGATISDVLEERDLSSAELAKRLGRSLADIKGLLDGRTRITSELAADLAAVLGGSARFWSNREAQYRADARRLTLGAESDADWLRAVPFADMVKYRWVAPTPPAGRLAACMDYFGVGDVDDWHARYSDVIEMTSFRTSTTYESLPVPTAAWLRQGEIQSAAIACEPWNPSRFRDLLPELRALTRKKDPKVFVPDLRKRCAECGVAVVVARAPKGCRASGATRFVDDDRALLLLSFRYLSDDQFWFSFFHEAGHLLLHGGRRTFLEGLDSTTNEETEANEFAAAALLPPRLQQQLGTLRLELREIARFARSAGVSPGIVVGQLQHRHLIARNHWNALKVPFNWDDLAEL